MMKIVPSVKLIGSGPGFNGELHEPVTGWQTLGNGYRVYNPVLMRFHSPDNLSPFGESGVNTYAYCHGDPVSHSDPTGHLAGVHLSLSKKFLQTGKRLKAEGLEWARLYSVSDDNAKAVIARVEREDLENVFQVGAYYRTRAKELKMSADKLLPIPVGKRGHVSPVYTAFNKMEEASRQYADKAAVYFSYLHSQKAQPGEVAYITTRAREFLNRQAAKAQQLESASGASGTVKNIRAPT